jgi:dGTPase
LTKLESRYPLWDGLNLTWETLEGAVKHNGPLVRADRPISNLPAAIQEYAQSQNLELDTFAGPEAQVAALADDIAYNNHDIDDGMRAKLFTIDDLIDLPYVGEVFWQVRAEYPDIEVERWTAEAVRRLIGMRIKDLVEETRARVARMKPQSADDVRALGQPLVAFSEPVRGHETALRRFLHGRMYRHYRVTRMRSQARRILRELFELFVNEPETLPDHWRERGGAPATRETARVVCDYIAGMTDAFAIEEHRRLFNLDRWM